MRLSMQMLRLSGWLLSSAALVVTGCSSESAPQLQRPAAAEASGPVAAASIGAWGFDLAGMDTTVAPGVDFFKYANGKWLASQQIPPDRSIWSSLSQLSIVAEQQLRTIVEALPGTAVADSAEQRARDFYRAFLDVEAIERVGLAPARPALDAIAAARTHADIARLIGRAELSLAGPIGWAIQADEKDPNRYAVLLGQSGLGLPDRDYYLSDAAELQQLRQAYREHLQRTFALLGDSDSAGRAKTVLELETRLARLHWPLAQRRERELTYNPKSRAELAELAAGFPWQELLAAAALGEQQRFIVAELGAVQALAKDFTAVPVASWREYLTYHYLRAHAAVLPQAFDAEYFGFYGRTLEGQPQQPERWKRALQALDRDLGEIIGKLYVQKHFPAEAKAQALALVEQLRAAYGRRIEALPWMTPATKRVALQKLAKFRPKIGYPDKWRDYSGLIVRPGDAFGNEVRAAAFQWQYQVARLNSPTDRDEWFLTPQTVNAYYDASFNEIVFPAAILQPPFFDPQADAAVNYGGIGGVIGHEMGHGFDDQGAKSDADGVLRKWWQSEDEVAFQRLVDTLVQQYNSYEALPGLKLNGKLTAGENIGDLGGLSVAYDAYRNSLGGAAAPVLDGFSGDQRFFLAWAQAWRTLQREPALRNQVLSNPHSPAQFRVQGVVRNMDAWYAAFNISERDPLFLPPAQRVRIW